MAKLKLSFCGAVDCGLPGSSVHGILQARILGFSRQEYWSALLSERVSRKIQLWDQLLEPTDDNQNSQCSLAGQLRTSHPAPMMAYQSPRGPKRRLLLV